MPIWAQLITLFLQIGIEVTPDLITLIQDLVTKQATGTAAQTTAAAKALFIHVGTN